MKREFYVIAFVVGGVLADYYKTIPSFVKTCFKKDPEFDDCSRDAVQSLFDALGPAKRVPGFAFVADRSGGFDSVIITAEDVDILVLLAALGLPEIGIPSLDPLKIPKIRILQGDGPVSVNAALDDVTVTGFGKTKVLLSQVDGKTYDFYTRVIVPKLRIEGTYDLRGKILLVPLVGRGLCWFEPTNMTIDIVSDVKLYEKDDLIFFNVTGAHVKYTIGGLQLRMNNLFDGIKSLEDSTNAYLNANWRPVSESLRPILSKTIEDILLGFLQQLFHNLPGNFMIGDVKIHSPSKKPDTIKKI